MPHSHVNVNTVGYVMLRVRVTFHHQLHHQQKHNVHVPSKVTVTTVFVQNISVLSLRNAHLIRLRRPVVSSLHNEKLVLQRPARPE